MLMRKSTICVRFRPVWLCRKRQVAQIARCSGRPPGNERRDEWRVTWRTNQRGRMRREARSVRSRPNSSGRTTSIFSCKSQVPPYRFLTFERSSIVGRGWSPDDSLLPTSSACLSAGHCSSRSVATRRKAARSLFKTSSAVFRPPPSPYRPRHHPPPRQPRQQLLR